MDNLASGDTRGYPASVEEYFVDVVPINAIIRRYRTAYLYSVYDSDGRLVGFAVSRSQADLTCLKLTAADRQSRINQRMEATICDRETTELPPKLRTQPDQQRITPPAPPKETWR